MQPVPVIRNPKVRVAITVIIEECYRLRLPAWVAHAVLSVIAHVRVVALVLVPGQSILVHDRHSITFSHPHLRTLHAGAFADVRECQVAVVAIKHIVLTVLVRHAHSAELILRQIAHIDVQPAIAVNIRASGAHGGASVNGIPKSGHCNVRESAVTVIQKQPVKVLVPLRLRAIVQPICQTALRPNIKVLIAVVVHIAGDNTGAVRLP